MTHKRHILFTGRKDARVRRRRTSSWSESFSRRQIMVAGANVTRPPLEGSAYQVLGVVSTAEAKELKKRYHQIAREWHPDISKHTDAHAVFSRVSESYKILSDPQQRLVYDFVLSNDIPRFSTPSHFVSFYERASRVHLLIRHRHAVGWAIAATIGIASLGVRGRALQGVSAADASAAVEPSVAPVVGGLFGATGGACSMLALNVRGAIGARYTLLAAAGGALGGRVLLPWVERRLGRLRSLCSSAARTAAANSRQLCELGGGIIGVLLMRRSTPALLWTEAHLRVLKSAGLGAVGGHMTGRVCGRSSESASE
jgi:hypothetical protein